MKQIYSKMLLLLLMVLVGNCAWAQVVSETLKFSSSNNDITINKAGAGDPGGDVEAVKGIVTVTSAGGQAPANKALQIYKTKTMTVSVPESYVITSIDFTYPTSCYPFAEAIPEGVANAKTKTEAGKTLASYSLPVPASSITFTNIAGGQTKINTMVVNYRPSGIETVNVTGISLNQTSTSILVGETTTLTATVTPENATNKNVTWSSSDKSVATVNNGVVKGVGNGTATITATTVDGEYTASCEVNVKAIPVSGITLDKTSLEVMEKMTATLVATVAPDNAANKSITWTSDNEEVATVQNGIITAVAAGTANITVTTVDGNYTATCAVTVTKYVKPSNIDIVFAANDTNSDTSAAWSSASGLNKVFANGYDFISSIAVDRVYAARNSLVYGAKFGSSSDAGSITIKLKEAQKVYNIIVSAAPYGDAEGHDGFLLNGTEVPMTSGTNKIYEEYLVKLDGSELSEITLKQKTANKGRIYVESIRLVLSDEPTYCTKKNKLTAKEEGMYYATFSSNEVTFFPNDYIVSAVGVENGKLYTFDNEEAFEEDIVDINATTTVDGYYVPANTGVLVSSLDQTITYYTVDGIEPNNDVATINMLRPSSAEMKGDFKFYKLAYGDFEKKTGLGFYYGAEDGAPFTSKAGLAYLAVPTASAVKAYTFSETTSVSMPTVSTDAKVIYNLNGQRLSSLQKGINLVGGKKIFVK